jgi:hypothetical protein
MATVTGSQRNKVLVVDTVNTGQGANELYAMNQNVRTSDNVTFNNVTIAGSISGYATESYVGTQISNLVDSSPAALNTLNELAAAIGDDASFSTTVTNSIALKSPLASPTFTGTVTTPNLTIGAKLPLAGGTMTGGLTGTTATFSGNAQVGGALKITETGTAQNLLIGNQDSGGTNKPAMIMGVNGYLRFGHGSSWSGEGGTFTEKLRVDNDTDVISGLVLPQ